MRIKGFIAMAVVFLIIGCATVKVQAPKEPIKVDISMRLDVYQHVQKDINTIEDLVTGSGSSQGAADKQSFLNFGAGVAYAQELSPQVEEAAMRRKARRGELVSLEQAGIVGESNKGLVQVMKPEHIVADSIVNEENADRMVIYNSIAAGNGTAVSDVQKLYAERLQKDAPSGTQVQADDGSWRTK
jgi:uncharacterized protein YdbL (DUF1318 family)